MKTVQFRYLLLYISFGFFLIMQFPGCATSTLPSRWAGDKGALNHIDKGSGQVPPQYYDKTNQFSVRIMNDSEKLYFAFNANGEELKKKLLMQGFTLWIDPEGGEQQVLGINVIGKFSDRMHPSGTGKDLHKDKPNGVEHQPLKKEELPERVEITYPDTTAAISMSREEALKAGINIEMNQEYGYFCKLDIPFALDPCLSIPTSGTVLGIGFESDRKWDSNGGKMAPGSRRGLDLFMSMDGSAMGKMGRNASSSRSFMEPYKVWFKIKLASDYKDIDQ